jgi:hypothetical protein
MSPHVGQRVVCIAPSRKLIPAGCTDAKVNEIYTVRSVVSNGVDVGITVVEIVNPRIWFGQEPGFYASRFRPVVNTDISVFRAMLTPVLEGV